MQQGNVRYCYNSGTIEGSGSYVGGITAYMGPHEAQSYNGNYLCYCYNGGTVSNRSKNKYSC